MKTHISLITLAGALALVLCAPAISSAKPKASPSPSAAATAESPAPKRERAISFHGKIASVDMAAHTFTVAGKKANRVFLVTDHTRITKDGAPAEMSDLAADMAVSGSYWKKSGGTLEAKTVKIGGKSGAANGQKNEKTEAATSPSPAP